MGVLPQDPIQGKKLDYNSPYWHGDGTLNNQDLNLDRSRNVLSLAYSGVEGRELRYVHGSIYSNIISFNVENSVKGWLQNKTKTFNWNNGKPWLCGFMIDESNIEDGRYAKGKIGWKHNATFVVGCIVKGDLADYPDRTSPPTDNPGGFTAWALGSKKIHFNKGGKWQSNYQCGDNTSWVANTGGYPGQCNNNYIMTNGTSKTYPNNRRWGDLWIR